MPHKQRAPKPKIDRKDWRNLPYSEWRTNTVHAMFIDLNRERFGVQTYIPMCNWAFEQGVIKRKLTELGAEVIREVIDEAFREYKPSREYPQLTAGFTFSYVASRLLPRILAERQRKEQRARDAERDTELTDDALSAWL